MAYEVGGVPKSVGSIEVVVHENLIPREDSVTSAGTVLGEVGVSERVFIGDQAEAVASTTTFRKGTPADVERAINKEFSDASAPVRAKEIIKIAVVHAREKRDKTRTELVDRTEQARKAEVWFNYAVGLVGGWGSFFAVDRLWESRNNIGHMSLGNIVLVSAGTIFAVGGFAYQDRSRKDSQGVNTSSHMGYIDAFEKAAHKEAVIQLLDSQLKSPQDEVIEVDLALDAEPQPSA